MSTPAKDRLRTLKTNNPVEPFVFPGFAVPDYEKEDPDKPGMAIYGLPDLKVRKPSKITAIRLVNEFDYGTYIRVQKDDRVCGAAYEDGKPLSTGELADRPLRFAEEVTIVVEVAAQGLVVIAMPDWFPDCCAPFMFTLGSFCPLDGTDAKGMTPTNRRLYWGGANPSTQPPTKKLEFRYNGDGRLTCAHLNAEHTMYLRVGPGQNAPKLASTHIVLCTRDDESGSIKIPAINGKPAAELKI